MVHQPARVGLDPVERVFLVENHDEAFRAWRDAGSANSVLVHIDAHHDMWWIDDDQSLTIANFITPALKSGLIRRLFWVVPDGTWQTAEGREAVGRHVRKITRTYPGVCRPRYEGVDTVHTQVLGKPLTICSLDALPDMGPGSDEGVLLDIDVDYLVTSSVSYGEVEDHGALPWCWPDELVSGLRARRLCTDLATIAYSVEGGYTPLRWKYLGDELALRLTRPAASGAVVGMDLMREGAQAADRGDIVTAEHKYRCARSACASSAAADFHLAQLYEGAGRIEDGRRLYRQALSADPSYRTPYSTTGFNHYWAGRLADADVEFRRTLSLDPEHAGSLLGLGMVAVRQERWTDAEALLRRSLAADDGLLDTHRRLADLLVKRGEYEEAIAAYEKSLALAMAGHKALGGLLATDGCEIRLLDIGHWKTHARLARLYERKGDVGRAIAGYRISLAAGHGGMPLRRRLARLCRQHGASE
jgi:tetratricopeptide (TPR) repeat protein